MPIMPEELDESIEHPPMYAGDRRHFMRRFSTAQGS